MTNPSERATGRSPWRGREAVEFRSAAPGVELSVFLIVCQLVGGENAPVRTLSPLLYPIFGGWHHAVSAMTYQIRRDSLTLEMRLVNVLPFLELVISCSVR